MAISGHKKDGREILGNLGLDHQIQVSAVPLLRIKKIFI